MEVYMKMSRPSKKAERKSGVWIQIEINKGVIDLHEGIRYTWSYRGLLDDQQYKKLVDNPDDRGFIRLDHVYWIDIKKHEDGELKIHPVRFGKDYIYRNFLGPLFIRACDVVSVIYLNGKKDLAWINDAARWKHPEELFLDHEHGNPTGSRPHGSVGNADTDRVWMEIETNKGITFGHNIHSHQWITGYRASFASGDIKRIFERPTDTGFVELDNVYWFENKWVNGELRIWPVRYGMENVGSDRNMLGRQLMRISHIATLAPMDGEADLAWMDENAKRNKREKMPKFIDS
jgi:hypothetical protein